uniref:NADH dehydrogenase subunit 6 n=1 Tax=Georissa bangueyensis TaxID=1882664 RepID=A0A1B2G3D0_9GAST|nr:NADH dehydrogenase subunit 6 [Georissa bangueyensis]
MTLAIILSLLISSIFLLPTMKQPMSLGLTIMMITFFISILLAFIFSSWYGYLLFLIYIGGLLVMFIYVSALIPNILFYYSPYFFSLIPINIFMVILFIYKKSLPFSEMTLTQNSNLISISKTGISLTHLSSINLFIILSLILFLVLLAVVKICRSSQGPLRPHQL